MRALLNNESYSCLSRLGIIKQSHLSLIFWHLLSTRGQ